MNKTKFIWRFHFLRCGKLWFIWRERFDKLRQERCLQPTMLRVAFIFFFQISWCNLRLSLRLSCVISHEVRRSRRNTRHRSICTPRNRMSLWYFLYRQFDCTFHYFNSLNGFFFSSTLVIFDALLLSCCGDRERTSMVKIQVVLLR